jgi:hypothetical protein
MMGGQRVKVRRTVGERDGRVNAQLCIDLTSKYHPHAGKLRVFISQECLPMKTLLSICMIVISSFVFLGVASANSAPTGGVVKGVVLEVKDVANFTYLRLKTSEGEIWAAVINTPVKKGAAVTIENAVVIKDFKSKALDKTFPSIVFGSLVGAEKNASSGHAASGSSATQTVPGQNVEMGKGEHIAKASGANARTVEEIIKKAAELKDKPVVVRGKVVKYNAGIMDKNWIHLRDGSGSAKDGTDDILVTTTSAAKLGDVVTVKGIVRDGKDFGAGYNYKVLIEEATLQ